MTVIIGQRAARIPTPNLITNKRRGFLQGYSVEEKGGDQGNTSSRYKEANARIARLAWTILQDHYPGHAWLTRASVKQGIVEVKLHAFTDWSQVVKLTDFFSDPSGKLTMRAGGDLLERFGLGRSGLELGHMLEAMKKFRPDYTRRLRPPG